MRGLAIDHDVRLRRTARAYYDGVRASCRVLGDLPVLLPHLWWSQDSLEGRSSSCLKIGSVEAFAPPPLVPLAYSCSCAPGAPGLHRRESSASTSSAENVGAPALRSAIDAAISSRTAARSLASSSSQSSAISSGTTLPSDKSVGSSSTSRPFFTCALSTMSAIVSRLVRYCIREQISERAYEPRGEILAEDQPHPPGSGSGNRKEYGPGRNRSSSRLWRLSPPCTATLAIAARTPSWVLHHGVCGRDGQRALATANGDLTIALEGNRAGASLRG